MACDGGGEVNWGGGWSMVGSSGPPAEEIFGDGPPRVARGGPSRERWGSQHTWQLIALVLAAAFLIARYRR